MLGLKLIHVRIRGYWVIKLSNNSILYSKYILPRNSRGHSSKVLFNIYCVAMCSNKYIHVICQVVLFLRVHKSLDVSALGFLFEYWIEHVTCGLLFVMIRLSAGIFNRGVSGFATCCPCGVWISWLTACLLYAGPHFGNIGGNNSRFVSLI